MPNGAVTGLSRLASVTGLVALVGLLPWLGDRDPAMAVLRATSSERELTEEALAAVRADLGLDAGPVTALTTWAERLLAGDLGTSWISGRPVAPDLVAALGVSATLAVFSFAVAFLVAALIVAPVLRRGVIGTPRAPSGRVAAALVALPEFLLAALLLIVAAVQLRWFPPYGWEGPRHAVLPALAMGIPAGGLLGGLLADAAAAVFAEPWVSTWRVAGFSAPRIVGAVLRRATATLAGQAALIAVGLLGGAVAVEHVFAVPGLGRATLSAAVSGDTPSLQAGILVIMLCAAAAGGLAALVRAAALGAALTTGSVPSSPVTRTVSTVRTRWVPLTLAAGLAVVLLAGLPRDPYGSPLRRLQAPDISHPLGADAAGRDLLARLAHGAGTTTTLAVAVTALSLAIGLSIGLMPGPSTGPIEVANALPPVVVGMLVAGITGPSRLGAAAAVTAVAWAPLAAHTASLIVQARATAYARLAPVIGVGPVRLLVRDILPTVVGPLVRHAALRLPGNALALAALGFLGLGSPKPEPDWGAVLAEALPYAERAPWAVLGPTAALVALAVVAQGAAGYRPVRRPGSAGRPLAPVAAEQIIGLEGERQDLPHR